MKSVVMAQVTVGLLILSLRVIDWYPQGSLQFWSACASVFVAVWIIQVAFAALDEKWQREDVSQRRRT